VAVIIVLVENEIAHLRRRRRLTTVAELFQAAAIDTSIVCSIAFHLSDVCFFTHVRKREEILRR
jgi:hypothetical protein